MAASYTHHAKPSVEGGPGAGSGAGRVREGDQRRACAGAARQVRPRVPGAGRRAQPHPDDEAAAGATGNPDRHQRAERPVLPAGDRRRTADRRAHQARAATGLRTGRRAFPDPARRGEGHRRPRGAQLGHDRRLAVPGGPVRGPVGDVRRAEGDHGDPRAGRAPGPCRPGSSTPRRTRRWSPPASCSPRSRSRSGPAAAARTRRSGGGSATGRSAPPVWCSGSTAAPSPTPGSGSPPWGRRHFAAAEAEEFLRGAAATEENFARAGQIAAEHCRPVSDQRGPAAYKRHLAANSPCARCAGRWRGCGARDA